MKKKTILISSLTALAIIGFSGSRANAFLKLPGPLQNLWDQSFGVVEEYVGFALNKSILNGLNDLAGELNLPDPGELWTWLDDVGDGTESGEDSEVADGINKGAVQGSQAVNLSKNAATSSIASAHSEAVIGKKGQEASAEITKALTESADQITDCAKAGSKLFITQDILKEQLCQGAAQGRILSTLAQQNELQKQQNAIANLNQARTLDAANRAETRVLEEKNQAAEGALGQAVFLNSVLGDQ